MRFNWLILVYLLVSCLPLKSGAQSSCRGLFTRPPNRLQQELIAQIPHGDRTVSPNKLIDKLSASGRARLETLGVQFEEKLSVLGESFLVIKPNSLTEYGRLALRMKNAYDGELIFDPERIVQAGSEGSAGMTRDYAGVVRPALFIGAVSLFTDRRLLRDVTILHELRHLRIMVNERNGIASPFYGEVEAISGRIPYALDRGETDYADYLSFSEIRTYHGDLRRNLIEVRRRLRLGLPAESVLDEAYSSLMYRSIVSHRTLATMKAARKATPSFDGQKAVMIAHADGAVLRIEIPLLAKKLPKSEALALQIDWLRNLAYDVAKQSERLLPDVRLIRTVADVDSILRQLPVNP